MQTYSTFCLLLLTVTSQAGELRCLRPGAPVLSLYTNSRYFPGRIEALGESIDVTFQNGKQQSYSAYSNDVIVDDIPDVSELTGGSRVLARRPSSTSFEAGFVNGFVNGSIEGLPLNDTYLVNYDSGDSIARNIEDIRLATKPGSCMNEKGIYIGCFENILNNYLTNYYPVNPTDVATCNWACFSRGFNFAGLQNGTWCFCGNHVNDSLKVDDSECNIACRDSREDVCGGYERMTVYWTGAESTENSTNEASDTNYLENPTLEQDKQLSETPADNGCSDIYDSAQCNAWAEDSRCIKDPDWMIANCKKSCYACAYDDHGNTANKPDSSPPSYAASDVVDQSQSPTPSTYPSAQPQAPGYYQSPPSDYAQNYYPSSQDSASAKKSDHPTLDNVRSAGYIGCFKDSPSSHDLDYLTEIRPLSIRACVTKCKSMRFPYAGAQSSTSCYCGLHFGKYGQLAHEDCNTPCEADSSEMCGGLFKNSLYNTGFPLKLKGAKDAFTRKTLPVPAQSGKSSPRPGDLNTIGGARSLFANPPAATHGYPSPQSSYSQPSSPGYNTYTPPASPSQVAYDQVRYTQVNGYPPSPPPAPSPNYQASQWPTNNQSPDYSPRDSSSYRWRETYMKLRAQEQERTSRLSRNNRRLRKTPKLSKKLKTTPWKTYPENILLHDYQKPRNKKHSKKFRHSHLGNTNKYALRKSDKNFAKFGKKVAQSAKTFAKSGKNSEKSGEDFVKFGKKSVKSGKDSVKSGENSVKTEGVSYSFPEKEADVNKHYSKNLRKKLSKEVAKGHFGKPGIFLRKKASEKNSFLAFLPHEVARDESLLENVYNMLSLMLKNLRKHKRGANASHSMKTLKEYLKIPGSNLEGEKTTPEGTAGEENGDFETHLKVHRESKKEIKKLKLQELSSRLSDPSSPEPLRTRKHPSNGQKQLSKEPTDSHRISRNRRGKHVTYGPRAKWSSTASNDSLSDPGKPSYVYKVIVRPETESSDEAVTSSLPSPSKILADGLDFIKHSEKVNSSSLETPAQNVSGKPSLPKNSVRDSETSVLNSKNSVRDFKNSVRVSKNSVRDSKNSVLNSENSALSSESSVLNSKDSAHNSKNSMHNSNFRENSSKSFASQISNDSRTRGQNIRVSGDYRNKTGLYHYTSGDRRNKSLHHRAKSDEGYQTHFRGKPWHNKSRVDMKGYEKNSGKAGHSKVNFSNGAVEKTSSEKDKSLTFKSNGKDTLKIDAPLLKELNQNGTSDDASVDKSDEDIISTIVQLLESEKNKRKKKKKKHKRNYKMYYGKSGGKMKRIYKKDYMERLSGKEDDNLMAKEEDYKEKGSSS